MKMNLNLFFFINHPEAKRNDNLNAKQKWDSLRQKSPAIFMNCTYDLG